MPNQRVRISIKRSQEMKKFLIIISVIVLILLVMNQFVSTNAQEAICPAGSYNIGENRTEEPLCKLEPTGCPYGDSIPLGPDCDKFAPRVIGESVPVLPEPTVIDTSGK